MGVSRPVRRAGKRVLTALPVVVLAVSPAAALPARAVSADVVIGEVYGGGGNTGAPFANDFVELHNRGTAPVGLAGWSVQYASAAGSSWLVTALGGSIAAGGSYLVKLGAGGTTGAAPPAPDATGTTNMSATAGKVALLTTTTALTCSTGCATAAGVRDFVGYGGTASSFEGSPAPGGSNTTSVARTDPASDTDDNAADFAAGTPTPQNSASGGGADCALYTGTRIHTVQGAAHVSPLNGQGVTNVRGVVTGRRSNGFWFQDPCPDGDIATSEGIFVFTSSAPTVAVGDEITVNATVSEFRSSSDTSALSETELTSPTITHVGTLTPPAPVVIGTGGRVPPSTVIEDDANGSVETGGVFDPATDGIDFYESLEGMRVQVDNPVAVGPYNASFGEIPVVGDGANAGVRTARGGILLRQADHNPERVTLDDAALAGSTPAGVNVGDHFSGPAVGPLDYVAGLFMVELTGPLTRVPGSIAKETTTAPPAGELSVATFNVENLAQTDPQSKFDGLANVVVHNLQAPDILGIEEVQDNNGTTNNGVVAADQTWNKLIAAISAAGGPPYAFRQIDPVNDSDGGAPGGNIRQGFLLRTDVTGLTFAAGTAGGPTQAEGVTSTGNPADPVNLTFNPGRLSPADSAFNASRKPLAGKFFFGGKPVFVIANHFNAKLGDDDEWGRFQPPDETTVTQRVGQATIVADFVRQITSIDPGARVVVLGDLNDYEFSTAVRTLDGAGLTDLPATLPDAQRYTYDFEGNSQVLDHILLSSSLNGAAHSYDVVHVNAEFADQISDHDPQVTDLTLP